MDLANALFVFPVNSFIGITRVTHWRQGCDRGPSVPWPEPLHSSSPAADSP